MRKTLLLVAGLSAALFVSTSDSIAQFNGHNTRGDYGLQSASQPPPGWYLITPIYLNYHVDVFKDANGDPVLPDEPDPIDVDAYVLGLIWVSQSKIFGANYSFQLYPAWTNNNLEVPVLGVEQSTSTGFADFYLQPINLGWHTKRADYTAGVGVYAPTGRYEFGADGNIGLGMWSFELFGGATAYFDKAKRWHFAALGFYETHTEKDGTDIRVGDMLPLEGGLGWSFLQGTANVGAAYNAQWKVTDDDLGGLDIDGLLAELGLDFPIGRNRVYGIGPEVSFPIATKKKLIAFLSFRYLWEFGARTSLEGETFMFSATFPIPSVRLQ